jgi:hypothetical protein
MHTFMHVTSFQLEQKLVLHFISHNQGCDVAGASVSLVGRELFCLLIISVLRSRHGFALNTVAEIAAMT